MSHYLESKPGDPLTVRQLEIFNFMVNFTREHFYQPSVRDVMGHFGYASTNAVMVHLRGLDKKGLIGLANGSRTRAIEFHRREPIGVTP